MENQTRNKPTCQPTPQLTNITELYGTNASSGYVALAGTSSTGLPPVSSFAVALASIKATAPNWGGPSLAFVLFCSFIGLVPTGRRLRRAMADYYLRGGWRIVKVARASRLQDLAISRRRLFLPSLFWRFASIITLLCVVGSDPNFQRWWNARAECTFPQNFSSDSTRITNFTYDMEGRLAQVNCPEGVINYGYDLATGRLTETCTKNSEIEYGYDELGRLKTVHVLMRNGSPVDETTTYHYDAVGNRSEVDLPNGIVTTYLYDNQGHGFASIFHLSTPNSLSVMAATAPAMSPTFYSFLVAQGNHLAVELISPLGLWSNASSSLIENLKREIKSPSQFPAIG